MKHDKSEKTVASKVVAIMQEITEEEDDSARKMWRKLLGIPNENDDETDESE